MAEKKTIELDVQSNLGSLRSQLREAQADVAAMADKFGATSREAAEAAKKAAELKDKIGDAKNLTDAFNPDAKFGALTKSLGGAMDGFQAVQGAMGMFGVESEDLQQTLLKVQSAMALSQGIQGVMEAKDSFVQLGSVVKDSFSQMTTAGKAFAVTGIGALVTGIGLLIANWDDLQKSIGGANETQDTFNDTLGDYKKGAADAMQATSKVGAAFELAREGVISKEEALETYNNTLGDTFGRAQDIDTAENLYAAKTDAYIKSTALRAQAQALFAKAAEAAAKGTTADLEDQTTTFDKLASSAISNIFGVVNGYNDLQNRQKQRVKETKDNAKQQQNALNTLATSMLKEAELIEKNNNLKVESTLRSNFKSNQSNQDTRNDDLENLKEYQQEAEDLFKSEYEIAVRNVKEKYDAQIELAKKYKEDTTTLEAARAKELKDLEDHQIDTTRLGMEKVAMLQVTHLDHTKEMQEQEKKGLVGVAEVKERIFQRGKQLDEEEKQRQKDKLDLALKYAQTFGQTMGSLNNLLNAQDSERLKSVKKGSKEEDAIKRKMFDRDKKLRIVQTIIDTASNVVNSVRNGGGIPTGIPFGIAAGAMGAFQVAAINKVKYDGGDNTVPSSSGGGGGAGGGSVMSPSFNVVGNSGINQLAQLQQQPTKAYVVSGDVTSAQSLDRNRIENATLVK
jgi:hypothetical protein